jgi:CBS domain-containing protein
MRHEESGDPELSPEYVRDLMTVGVPTCRPDAPVPDIARFVLEHGVEAMCVLDDEGHAIGVVGISELVAAYGREDLKSATAEDIMNEELPELQAELPLTAAAQIMRDQGTRVAYMMHNAGGITYPAAFISWKHLLRHVAARSEEDLKDLGTDAQRKSPIAQFMERRDAARRRNLGENGDR